VAVLVVEKVEVPDWLVGLKAMELAVFEGWRLNGLAR
jgi:hypothetical protein